MKSLFVALLSLFAASPLVAQAPGTTPAFQIFVDTAGVSAIPDSQQQYVTWIYARQSEQAPPVTGVLVAFDCGKHLVNRIAHVVFHPVKNANGTFDVSGKVEYDNGGWVAVHNEAMFTLVCSVGAEHDKQAEWEKDPDNRQTKARKLKMES